MEALFPTLTDQAAEPLGRDEASHPSSAAIKHFEFVCFCVHSFGD